MEDMLLIVNYNDRYASSIAMKLRAEKIYCRIIPGNSSAEYVVAQNALGIVLAGSVNGEVPAMFDGNILRAGIPVMALGDAATAVCKLLSGRADEPVVYESVQTVKFLASRVTDEASEVERMLNVIRPLQLPDDMVPVALVEDDVIGFAHTEMPFFGFEFQLETNDIEGVGILLNFAKNVCGCTSWWSENAFISSAKADISDAVQDNVALCALTGGLVSGVTALLAHRALGDKLRCIFIDTGLLREGEADSVMDYYGGKLQLPITYVNAQDRFVGALKGLHASADKKSAIYHTMQAILNETSDRIAYQVAIHSTSCSDVLRADCSDIHPNIQAVDSTVDPLRELFKEEIRHIGAALGMPPEVYQTQPFPDTGLALRIIGEVNQDRLDVLRRADAIFREEINQAGLNKRLWKYFCMLYHIPFEGNDSAVVIGLRAVNFSSGMTHALPARLPYDLLERFTQRAHEACPQIIKVFYDITPGESFTDIEWH